MPKKRVVRDPQDEVDAQCKLLCDEAGNHMKVRNYTRALSVYQKSDWKFRTPIAHTMAKVRDILGVDKESEFLQSFVRVGLSADADEHEPHKSVYKQTRQQPQLPKQASDVRSDASDSKSPRRSRTSITLDFPKTRKKKGREYYEEMYTDKDRAAAVSYGSFDIKQSLNIKRKQDRSKTLQLPEEADPGALLTLGQREFKNGNTEIAVLFLTKALELNSSDQNALVARSKCYLLLGDPTKGLEDAETAISHDKNNIRAIYQKAEALYFLGQFEMSLMFFHRGLRLRPELNSFRLGVQKTQEAIEKTIGGFESSVPPKRQPPNIQKQANATNANDSDRRAAKSTSPPRARLRPAKVSPEKREARKLLGELCVDKEYLENLLKHPDLKRADTGSENISALASDAVRFLNTRQEFWRQQRPCTALPKKKPMQM